MILWLFYRNEDMLVNKENSDEKYKKRKENERKKKENNKEKGM